MTKYLTFLYCFTARRSSRMFPSLCCLDRLLHWLVWGTYLSQKIFSPLLTYTTCVKVFSVKTAPSAVLLLISSGGTIRVWKEHYHSTYLPFLWHSWRLHSHWWPGYIKSKCLETRANTQTSDSYIKLEFKLCLLWYIFNSI